MNKKKLFFPTDFTKHSKEVLQDAVKLNKSLDYEIILFHAYSRPYSESKSHDPSQLGELERKIDNKFSKLLEDVPELKDTSHQFIKKLGFSVEMIIEEVQSLKPDLIIMYTKGAVGLGEIFGTKTAKIIKSVDMPVIVMPANTKLSEFDRVGLACDFSENTDYEKVDFLVELAKAHELQIDLITHNRQEKTMTKDEIANRRQILEILRHLDTRVSFTEHDNIEQGLIDYCKKHEIGLLGILPKSYSFIERVFHESITQRMAFHSPIPLLVLK